jgi:hypothetical protein
MLAVPAAGGKYGIRLWLCGLCGWLHICWPHIQVRKQRFRKASGIPSMQAIWKVSPEVFRLLHNSASMA